MNNLLCKAVFGTLLLAGASAAMANTAQLKVSGTIQPGSCTVNLANGELNFGEISAADLSPTVPTPLEAQTVNYSISCTAPMKVATAWSDDGEGAPAGSQYFGLGTQSGTPLGNYTLTHIANESFTDGGPAYLIKSTDNGSTWATGDLAIGKESTSLFTVAASAIGTEPKAFTTYTGAVNLQASINSTAELDVTREIALDGQASLEIRYL